MPIGRHDVNSILALRSETAAVLTRAFDSIPKKLLAVACGYKSESTVYRQLKGDDANHLEMLARTMDRALLEDVPGAEAMAPVFWLVERYLRPASARALDGALAVAILGALFAAAGGAAQEIQRALADSDVDEAERKRIEGRLDQIDELVARTRASLAAAATSRAQSAFPYRFGGDASASSRAQS